MSASSWKLSGEAACLAFPPFNATVQLARPGLGLHQLRVGESLWPEAQLLGVEWDGMDGIHAVDDCYVRGEDLIVAYAESPQQPYAPQIYWRGGGLGHSRSSTEEIAQLELLVSVQTPLLDAEPRMTARSTLRASEVLILEDADAQEYLRWEPEGKSSVPTGCLLLRLADRPLSYVEIMHPQDFHPDQLQIIQTGQHVTIRHTLLACRMEKGVIIRVRLRGGVVQRHGDTAAAAAMYQAFAGSALPLSA